MIVECPGCQSRYDVTGRPAGTRARCRCGTTFVLSPPGEFAATLNCPQCGAACDPARPRCTYCAATLAVVACARCFGRAFQGAKHCQHCGASVEAPARASDGKPSARSCPRCGSAGTRNALTAHLVAETLVDECADCGGVWVDGAAFERVVKDKDRQAVLATSQIAAPHGDAAPKPQPMKYLKCPDCTQIMTRRNFGKRSGILVDVCTPHGIWFDSDELGAAVRFVMNGGLDETRRRELEEIERKLVDKRRQVTAMSTGMPVGAGGSQNPGGGGWLVDVLFEILR